MFDCKDIDKIDNISLKKLLNLRCDRIINTKTIKFKKNNYINIKLFLLFLLVVFIIYIFKNKNKKQRK